MAPGTTGRFWASSCVVPGDRVAVVSHRLGLQSFCGDEKPWTHPDDWLPRVDPAHKHLPPRGVFEGDYCVSLVAVAAAGVNLAATSSGQSRPRLVFDHFTPRSSPKAWARVMRSAISATVMRLVF